MTTPLEAIVMGRAGVDLYPMQLETRLEDVDGFHKYAGGFAANVATGLARLGVRVAIVSAVGDDGHGRFVRAFLEAEGVDCRWLGVHPTLRTALAFCEAWPPDHFPITFYRTPTCPDWELEPGALDLAGDRRGAAALRQRHRPRAGAVAAGDDGGRRGARARRPGRRCSISTGARCSGTTRPTMPPPCGCAPAWPTSCSDPTRRSPPPPA